MLCLYLLQRLQGSLPGSPGFVSVDPDQEFNTAASFVSHTDWRSHYGEQAMGHVAQTGGLAVQNFVSAGRGYRRRARTRLRPLAHSASGHRPGSAAPRSRCARPYIFVLADN